MDTIISRNLQDKVEQELESGERIEWIGTPIPRFFTLSSTILFLFAIPWTAFAIFWIWGASGFGRPDFRGGFDLLFPAFFGLPFVLIGFGMLLNPLWTYRKALESVYVITDRRAITFEGGWTTTVRSYPPDKLSDVYRKEKKDGTGDVIIHVRIWRDPEGERRGEELGFLRVRNPKEVENRLRKLAEQKR